MPSTHPYPSPWQVLESHVAAFAEKHCCTRDVNFFIYGSGLENKILVNMPFWELPKRKKREVRNNERKNQLQETLLPTL